MLIKGMATKQISAMTVWETFLVSWCFVLNGVQYCYNTILSAGRVYILDMYNPEIYPYVRCHHWSFARWINCLVQFRLCLLLTVGFICSIFHLQDYRARRFIDQKVEVAVSQCSVKFHLELIWLFCVTLWFCPFFCILIERNHHWWVFEETRWSPWGMPSIIPLISCFLAGYVCDLVWTGDDRLGAYNVKGSSKKHD